MFFLSCCGLLFFSGVLPMFLLYCLSILLQEMLCVSFFGAVCRELPLIVLAFLYSSTLHLYIYIYISLLFRECIPRMECRIPRSVPRMPRNSLSSDLMWDEGEMLSVFLRNVFR